jgi:hypothetical protein
MRKRWLSDRLSHTPVANRTVVVDAVWCSGALVLSIIAFDNGDDAAVALWVSMAIASVIHYWIFNGTRHSRA